MEFGFNQQGQGAHRRGAELLECDVASHSAGPLATRCPGRHFVDVGQLMPV